MIAAYQAEEKSTAQHADVLDTRDDEETVLVSQCKCERGVRREKTVRGRREPRFVGLLRNVLSCRRTDDMPTQLLVDEVLTQESQSSETAIDDIMTDVNVLRMEDGRVEACLIWESTGIASCIQVRKENLEITRAQQYIRSAQWCTRRYTEVR